MSSEDGTKTKLQSDEEIEEEDEDTPETVITATKDYELIIDGFRCPDEWVQTFTPLDFEEMVATFKEYDANGGGTIDIHEIRKILLHMDMDVGMDKAKELMKLIDVDGNGEIDFEEYCRFIAMMRRGDPIFAEYTALLDKMNNTPIGLLEEQAKLRNFKTQFVVIEEREATASQEPLSVVELLISGEWHMRVDGRTVSNYEVKRFQGMGKYTKAAKTEAVKKALTKLRSYMPGVHYAVGEFPDEWMKWADDNLIRGIKPLDIIDVIVRKGFHPSQNVALMHKLCASAELDQFLAKNPNFSGHDLGKASLDLNFLSWVKSVGDKGIDGGIFLEVLLERDIQVHTYQIHLAQKIRNNEYSSLIDMNGGRTKFMDFWTACEDGLLLEVELYIAAEAKVDEEKITRTGESLTPLMLAAKGNHKDVVCLLIEKKANLTIADRRGRTALHHAALHGATECCGVLMDNGAMLFSADNVGNTPLHLAAMKNKVDVIDYLAAKGQDFTRAICADKVTVKRGISFNELSAEIFLKVQDVKLRPVESRRFQKDWLHDAANMFREAMDHDRRHMLAPTSEELMKDVLLRFDPRPETGISVSHGVDGGQIFIPTIPSPNELGVLLRYMFRQSALDNSNNMLRTPLHVACDENVVESHREGIMMLISKYGVNVLLKDYKSMTPFDLLIVDKQHSAKAPTSTSQREQLLFDIRDEKVKEMALEHEAEDKAVLDRRRQDVLDVCIRSAVDMPEHLWDAARGASQLKAIYGSHDVENTWHMYEDPETKNRYFVRAPVNVAEGDVFNSWTWELPDEIRSEYHFRESWLFQRLTRSEVVTTFGDVVKLRCKKTNIYFYYFVEDNEYQFDVPEEFEWSNVAKGAVFKERYGFSMEWQEFEKEKTNFYYNRLTQEYRWVRPQDAVTVTPSERFCTTYGVGNRRVDQKWYTCDQCNNLAREMNMQIDPENTKSVIMKICEPCINRCHRGHKGTRLVRKAPVTCVCNSPLFKSVCSCKAQEESETQIQLHQAEQDQVMEDKRSRQHNALMPPIFCQVPKFDRNGNKKRESGWMICRNFILRDQGIGATKEIVLKEQSAIQLRKQNADWRDISAQAEKDAKSKLHTLDFSDTSFMFTESEMKTLGSPCAGRSHEKFHKQFIAAAEMDYSLFVEESFQDAYSKGWRKVYDPEEPEVLEPGSRVLCVRSQISPKCYGTVEKNLGKGVYLVKFASKHDKEKLSRDKIELISKDYFYFHVGMKVSVWNLPPLYDESGNPMKFDIRDFPRSESIEMAGDEWQSLRLTAHERRAFKNYDEFEDPLSKLLFYVHNETYYLELACIGLQNWLRKKKRLPRIAYWTSSAFSFNKPEEVFEEEKTKSGWALLRRRSKCVGDFQDVHFQDWEELMDEESADFFYWQEDTDTYSWDKPETFKAKKEVKIEPLAVGEHILFMFPNKDKSEVGIITRLRTDDETLETMYDIQHRMDADLKAKWVPRYMIKKIAKTAEETKLALSASAWKKQIRRKRDKDHRQRQIARKKRIAEEMAKRQQLAEGVDIASKTSNSIGGSSVADLERGRIIRARAEKKHREDLRNAVMLEKQRIGIEEMMQDMDMGKIRLSKSEQISMQRALAIKLDVENKMERRNEAQAKLMKRRKQVELRVKTIDDEVRKKEDLVTTPRSLIRRRLLREVHYAMIRQEKQLVICDWGCGDWVRLGQEQQDHQMNYCSQRIVRCALHCDLKMSESEWLSIPPVTRDIEAEEWENYSLEAVHGSREQKVKPEVTLTRQELHESKECPKRMVPCPNQCLEWVPAETLDHHMQEMCVKRDAKPIECRLGCGKMFGGIVETMIEAEEERIQHEDDECEFRRVQCSWRNQDGSYCAAQICATERNAHRDMHLEALGVSTYTVPGMYRYKVPPKVFSLKIQLWGGGGGSGHFLNRRGGSGGGGGYVEIFVNVQPYDILDIVVGEGGRAGAYGTEIEMKQTNREYEKENNFKGKERGQLSTIEENEDEASSIAPDKATKVEPEFELIEQSYGIALGGEPGGGQGFGGGSNWAAGGGGGYSIVSRRVLEGSQVYAVAGGGGGGGSQGGVPGCGMDGALVGSRIDSRNGGCGNSNLERGGAAGDSGSIHNSAWPAMKGEMWQGGNGSQFGGGGGGGYFGGGGGGTSPGIAAGGGGGSSFVYTAVCRDYVIIHGEKDMPGGLEQDPPDAVGIGEWDKVGGIVGTGGAGHPTKLNPGKNGAVRILKPGFF